MKFSEIHSRVWRNIARYNR